MYLSGEMLRLEVDFRIKLLVGYMIWNRRLLFHCLTGTIKNDLPMLYSRVVSRKLYKGEVEAVWPGPDVFWDWDMWLRDNENRKDRECIIPDVSRTYHFGATGLNMNPFFQRNYFSSHAFNTKDNVKFNVDIMYKDNYERELERLLR